MPIAELIMVQSVLHVPTDIMSEQKESAFQLILFADKTIHKETVPHVIQDTQFKMEDVLLGKLQIQIVKHKDHKDVLSVMLDFT